MKKNRNSYINIGLFFLLVFIFNACNNPKKNTSTDKNSIAVNTDTLSTTDTIVTPPVNDSLAKYISGSIHLKDEILHGARIFKPKQEEIQKLDVPATGIFSFLDFDIRYNPGIDSRLIAYANNNESDVRIFWTNYKDSILSYVKEIGRFEGDNPLEFGFDMDSRILKMEYYNTKTGLSYYKLKDNGEFRLLDIPVLYEVKNKKLHGANLPAGTWVSLFNLQEEDNADYAKWIYPVKSPNLKEYYNRLDTNENIEPQFAVEGEKTLTILQDMSEIAFDWEKHESLRKRFVSSMEGDATANFISEDMKVYEITYLENVYQIYSIVSSFRYGNYTWFFATVNNNPDYIYMLSSVPGTIASQKIFVLDNDLFFYLYSHWTDAEGNDREGGFINYLGPDICFDAVTIRD